MSVKLPIGMPVVDFEVKALVDEFGVEDPSLATDLVGHASLRPNTKSSDLQCMRSAMRDAKKNGHDPIEVLRSELQRHQATYGGAPGRGYRGKGDGSKGKGKGSTN